MPVGSRRSGGTPAGPRGRQRRWPGGLVAGLAVVVASGCTAAGAGATPPATAAAPRVSAGAAAPGIPEGEGTPTIAATNAVVKAPGRATRASAAPTRTLRRSPAPSASARSSSGQATQPAGSGPADPSGVAMPVGNRPGWRQVFTDDFTGNVPLGDFPAAVSAKWGGYDGATDTTGNGTYVPGQVVSIHNGMMDLYLHTANGVHLVAAPEPVIPGAGPGGGLTYGMYEVRFKAQPVPGYKTAWLLWPDSNQWSDGEIDWPEGNLNATMGAFMHHVGDPEAQDAYLTSATYGTWHTATIEWTPSAVTFLLDGKVTGSSTGTSLIPRTPMHWVLQTETQLSGGPPSDSAAGHVDIDWVAVYARD